MKLEEESEIKQQEKSEIKGEMKSDEGAAPVLPVGGEVSKATLFPIPDSIFLIYSLK